MSADEKTSRQPCGITALRTLAMPKDMNPGGDTIVGLSVSMSVQEKITGKTIEERLESLAVAAPSEQALHLCLVVG
jgi:hypothetical protein